MTIGNDSGSVSQFGLGDIKDNKGPVVVGNHSAIIMGGSLTQVQHDLLGKLDEFMGLLARHADSVEDAASVRESVEAVASEVRKPSPRWSIVRTLLRGVIGPVTGVAVLTEVINNVLEIVSHLVN
jgi:hypothetical protein